jgi:hypothetical protein
MGKRRGLAIIGVLAVMIGMFASGNDDTGVNWATARRTSV